MGRISTWAILSSEADLIKAASHRRADLSDAILNEANLIKANLREADLSWANLSGNLILERTGQC